MKFSSDAQRRAAFRNMFSVKPDYSLDTWKKSLGGVPKFKIDEHYRDVWAKIKPQIEGRNVLIRYLHGDNQVVRRHPPGSKAYITIDDVDDLSNIVREHGVEVWVETAKKGDLYRGDTAVLDIDNMGSATDKELKDVTKAVYNRMGKSFGGKPYVINTAGGYHVGVKLNKPMYYQSMRNKADKDVIEPLEQEFNGLVSKSYDKSPIYIDKTPMKLHGSTRAVGSLNLPDLTITERVSIDDLDNFKASKL